MQKVVEKPEMSSVFSPTRLRPMSSGDPRGAPTEDTHIANRNWANGGRQYAMHVKPVLLDCSFIVDHTNGNGLGIRSLKGGGIQNVFMNTNQTPGAGNSNAATPNVVVTNPNPAAGTIVVQLQDNYNRVLGGGYSIVSPLGSNLKVDAGDAALTAGVAYVITILGDATAADWLALGVPAGVTPAVGVAFIAAATGHGTASVTRVAPTAAAGSSVFQIEAVGDGNLACAPVPTANQGFGAQLIFQCRDAASGGASQIATPADGTVISLQIYLSDSSVLIQGE